MIDIIIEFIISLFESEKSTSGTQRTGKNSNRRNRKRQKRDQLSNEALKYYKGGEQARKQRDVEEAEKLLDDSCKAWITYSKATGHSPAPAPFRELSKLYYHTNRDQEALSVIDDYLKHSTDTVSGNLSEKRKEMKKLRKRLSTEDFRRQNHIYEDYLNNHPELK